MNSTEILETGTVVKPQGKITAANADDWCASLQKLIGAGAKHIIIDLEKVDIIDSRGLGVFVVCYKTLLAAKGTLTVLTDNADFRDLFTLMRLDEHFTVKGSKV